MMVGSKNSLFLKAMRVSVMTALLAMAMGQQEGDNLAMESTRGSFDEDYDFAAFLAKAGEVLGDPGGDWGNRVEDVKGQSLHKTQSQDREPQVRSHNLRISSSRKTNQRVTSQLGGGGRTSGSSQFQIDPLANVTKQETSGDSDCRHITKMKTLSEIITSKVVMVMMIN